VPQHGDWAHGVGEEPLCTQRSGMGGSLSRCTLGGQARLFAQGFAHRSQLGQSAQTRFARVAPGVTQLDGAQFQINPRSAIDTTWPWPTTR
jgi:hypothetical protein